MSFVLLGILNSQAGAGGAFPTPEKTFAWFDADDASTITESSGAVSQWNDKSNNGFNLSQATGSKQPNINTTTLNGKPVMRFEDFDTLVASTPSDWIPLHDGTEYIIAAVIKWDADASIVSSAFSTGAGTDSVGMVSRTNSTTLTNLIINGINGDAVASITFSYSRGNSDFIGWIADPDNATLADRLTVQINESQTANNTENGTPSSSDPLSALKLGFDSNQTGRQFSGHIAELIIATGENATQENFDAAKAHLEDKWGI